MAKAKRRRKTAGKHTKPVARKRVRRTRSRGPATSLGNVMSNLVQARDQLVAERGALESKIAVLDRALAAMGAASASVRRGRRGTAAAGGGGRRSGSLKDHIARVLTTKKSPMAVKDITAAVRKSGYATTNKTLAKSVGIALAQMPDVNKVGRGMFCMK
ncbi:MAG: hypothetical protein PVJ57_01555 [Phycisphaerae bacterium]|jgi:hypothetical protein